MKIYYPCIVLAWLITFTVCAGSAPFRAGKLPEIQKMEIERLESIAWGVPIVAAVAIIVGALVRFMSASRSMVFSLHAAMICLFARLTYLAFSQ
ncbi:MAG: hypothetical protein JNL58_04950 [Planctomyces sp.]|nr:hypothetical protein [Planctomyces sp.]